ncbi:MAG: hypothetical protein WBS54_09550 [Acidobacteriota bacterium]
MKARLALVILLLGIGAAAFADGPYFDTYTHHMEVGEWELEAGVDAVRSTDGPWAYGQSLELEHGFNAHFCGSVYLLGAEVPGTGWRLDGFKLESRVRPWTDNSFFVPTLYVEYEQFSHEETYQDAAVGNRDEGGGGPFRTEHSAEFRLIFSQDFGWGNAALNLVGERSLDGGRAAFGYTGGVYFLGPSSGRPGAGAYDLDRDGDSHYLFGFELFGGLGEEGNFGLKPSRQEHYIEPLVAVPLTARVALKVGVAFGLTRRSEDRVRVLLSIHLGRSIRS